ncbi:MAG: hypothetical protein AB9846_17515 [Tenuifilaceae bacterium]
MPEAPLELTMVVVVVTFSTEVACPNAANVWISFPKRRPAIK